MYHHGFISISAGTNVRSRETWHEDGLKFENYEKAKVSKMKHMIKKNHRILSQNFRYNYTDFSFGI